MLTSCPSCQAIFRARAHHLSASGGMVRCAYCKTVFNALKQEIEEIDGDTVDPELLKTQLKLRPRELGQSPLAQGAAEAGAPTNEAPSKTREPKAPATSTPKLAEAPEAARDASAKASPTAHAAATPSEPHADLSASERAPSTFGATAADASRAPQDSVPAAASGAQRRASPHKAPLLSRQNFRLALRNLARHRRRSSFGFGCIAFGVIALMVAGGFAEWMMWAKREASIHSRLGHIQVVRDGFYERGIADPGAFLMADDAVDLAAVRALPGVVTVTPRYNFSGLISKGDTTLSFLGEGVAPSTEALVSDEVFVHAGEGLRDDHPNGIILGRGLADSLGAGVGDGVVLVTTLDSGSINAVEATVAGVFHTVVKAYDDVVLRTPITLARQLNRSEGAHKYVVLLDRTERTDATLAAMNERLKPASAGLQLVPWIDLADFYRAVVDLFMAQTNFVRVLIAAIILLTISNTLAMSVRERTSEIGTLLALGMRSRQVLGLFLSEGLLLGLGGGLIGTALGYGLCQGISAVGIPMPPAPGMADDFIAAIRVTPEIAITGIVLAVLAATLASVLPAIKASKLSIVDALRHAK